MTGMDNIAIGDALYAVRSPCSLPQGHPHRGLHGGHTQNVVREHDKYNMHIGEKGNQRLTVKKDIVDDDDDERGDGDDAGADGTMARMVNVDVMGGGLTSLGLGVPPLFSKPHDQPYLMQPYATKPLQFHSFTDPDTTPYKFPTVGVLAPGTAPWEGECHVRATVQQCNRTTVQ